MRNSRYNRYILAALVLSFAAVILTAGAVSAQSGDGFELSWNVIAAGGGAMSGSGYEIQGTIGQTTVGSSSGSGFRIWHGFWSFIETFFLQFLPSIAR